MYANLFEQNTKKKSDKFLLFNFRVSSMNSGETQNLSFCKGLKLLETNCVENVLQVGE